MSTNKRPPKITSPKGRFMWPKLTEPDHGTNDFPDPDGSYNVKLVLDADSDEAKGLLKRLQPAYDEAIAEAEAKVAEMKVAARKKLEKVNGEGGVQANDLYEVLYDKETEEPTGEIAFRFKMKASGEYNKGPKAGKRWHRKPAIFDARGRMMTKLPDIWGGTIGRVTFTTRGYLVASNGAAGLSLQLEAAQIIDLVSGGTRSASDFGFGEEEGYAHDDKAQAEDETDEDEFDGDNNEGDNGDEHVDF